MPCLQVTAAKILEIPVIATEQYPKGNILLVVVYCHVVSIIDTST